MILIMWLIILSLLFLSFSKWDKHQQNPNIMVSSLILPDGSKELRLQRNKFGHYLIDGKINNVPVTFLLDTGATSVAVSSKLAKKLRLEAGAYALMSTAGGEVHGNLTKIDVLEFGNIRFKNIRAVIMPDMDSEVLLGMSVLKNVEFEQKSDELIIKYKNKN